MFGTAVCCSAAGVMSVSDAGYATARMRMRMMTWTRKRFERRWKQVCYCQLSCFARETRCPILIERTVLPGMKKSAIRMPTITDQQHDTLVACFQQKHARENRESVSLCFCLLETLFLFLFSRAP